MVVVDGASRRAWQARVAYAHHFLFLADDKIKGTFYDRDYVMRLSHGAQPAYNVHIKDIMNTSVTSATPDAPLTECVPLRVVRAARLYLMSSCLFRWWAGLLSAVWGMADTFFLPVMKTSVATDEIECLQEAEAEAEADVDSAADQVDKTAADAALAAAKDSTDSVDAAEDRKDGKDDSKLEPANVADDAAADANLGALPLSALSTMLTLNDVLAFLVAHVDTRSSSKSSKDDSKTQGEADSADERLFKGTQCWQWVRMYVVDDNVLLFLVCLSFWGGACSETPCRSFHHRDGHCTEKFVPHHPQHPSRRRRVCG